LSFVLKLAIGIWQSKIYNGLSILTTIVCNHA
jgi:hypothetical protein